jgi:hypothetical protein
MDKRVISMFLIKWIENKNLENVKKFVKVFYIVISAVSALNLAAGIAMTVMFILNKTVLYLVLMCTFFICAAVFYAVTLFGSASLYACIDFVSVPKEEILKNEEIKKEAAAVLQAQKMFEKGLLNESEYHKEKRSRLNSVYSEFEKMGRKEVLANFMYLNKCGAISDDELENEKNYYFNEINYKKALRLMRGGDYAEAADLFKGLGSYRSSAQMLLKLKTDGKI